MTPDGFVAALRARAAALGFETCRIVRPDAIPEAPQRLAEWLASGAHGDMGWMAETADRRASPRMLWPRVASIIMLGTNYGPDADPLSGLAQHSNGSISVYARHRDYHEVMKGRLKQLASWLVSQQHADAPEVKVFVDTAPVMEKPLAQAAGLGWQGKHTNLVSREFGSWLFLGSIFTTLELPPDAPQTDHCGSCHACLDICPTDAFPAPYKLDARRCISYLTIEYKGHIPSEFRKAMGNRIYGCDDCLAVCPWNKYASATADIKLQARADLTSPSLQMLAALDDAGFRTLFSGSPVKRIGHDRFLRNVMIAIGNSGDVAFVPMLRERLMDTSPLIRAMAVWACSRLMSRADFYALATSFEGSETDADVLGEWRRATQAQEPTS